MHLPIKKLSPDAILPQYAHAGDAGLDFFSNEHVTILPNERHAVATGIAMAIPFGYVGLLWDRSGLAVKNGIKLLGGVIDASYRGEIKIIMYNTGTEPLVITKGMKIAQMLIQQYQQCTIQETNDLPDTSRGDKGFGSTG
ncbi:dUTP diphosphatase [Candidatus Woesearchaeota archaeon]|nr:dUTP diphosphatase [Candidatus Woesearchaeota archaeon]